MTVLVIQDDTVLMIGGSITPEDAQSLDTTALGRLDDVRRPAVAHQRFLLVHHGRCRVV